MITSDLVQIISWWSILLIIGLTFLPITSKLFANFWDKGYIFAKILGLLITSYLVWLLPSLKLAAFSSLLILGVLALVLVVNLIVFNLKRPAFKKDLLVTCLLEELIFTFGLFFWAYVKSFEPSIHGLEKFMDYGFINSILRSDYFPPKDLWLTPLSINYYYFGHFVAAMLIKITQVQPDVGFNLILATLFGLTLTGSFSLSSNLYHHFLTSQNPRLLTIDHRPQTILAGLLSAFLVTLGGNLQTIYAFFQNYTPADKPVPFWQLPLMLNFQGYWYPNATRFIPFTIHEFPIYSFVVSDLHGHVLNIPFVLLTIAILIQLYLLPSKQYAIRYTLYALLSLLIATSLMTNILDAPIYLLGIFLVTFFKELKDSHSQPLISALKPTGIVLLLAILFSLPYWLSFRPFGSGIGVLCAPTFLTNLGHFGALLFEPNHCMRSPIWMLAILWGFFYFVIFSFIFSVILISIRSGERSLANARLKQVERFLTTFGMTHNTDKLVLIFALFATILITIPEFVYVKDIYPAHYRANTVFKFGYQAFIIFGLISGYMLTRIIQTKKLLPPLFIILTPLFLLVAIYPFFAINSYFAGLKNYQGLDGLTYFQNFYPTDYRGILWLRKNVSGQPVILEAQGDSYTDFARVSANTGLPTVIGWPVHEWLWRGSYDEAGKRSGEVTQIYQSSDLELTKRFLKQYKVSYIFVGVLERQKYTSLNEDKFKQLGKVVFQEGATVIYRVGSL